jgi:hypothetical protein
MSVLFALAAPAAGQICTTPAECANLGVDRRGAQALTARTHE